MFPGLHTYRLWGAKDIQIKKHIQQNKSWKLNILRINKKQNIISKIIHFFALISG